jgi:hypothetical protein
MLRVILGHTEIVLGQLGTLHPLSQPKSMGKVHGVAHVEEVKPTHHEGGTETILVVEDEQNGRQLATD